MSDVQDFVPLSPRLGITGSSYQLEMGKVNEFWAIRLVKGKDVLDSHVFKESKDLPNANRLTGWVLSVLVIPNINTYQIQKTIGFIRQKAQRREEDLIRAKKSAGKEESKNVVLEKTPEKLKKRPQSKGVVKDVEDEEGKVKVDAAAVSPSLAASNKAASSNQSAKRDTQATVVIGGRELPVIPRGEGFVPNPEWMSSSKGSVSTSAKTVESSSIGESNSASTSSSNSQSAGTSSTVVEISEKDILTALLKSSEYQDLLKRVDALEHRVSSLQQKNEMLTNEISVLKNSK